VCDCAVLLFDGCGVVLDNLGNGYEVFACHMFYILVDWFTNSYICIVSMYSSDVFLTYLYTIICHCRCLVVIPTLYGSTIIICVVKFCYKVGSGVGFAVGSIVWRGLVLQERKGTL
jgi:hypothetical protein